MSTNKTHSDLSIARMMRGRMLMIGTAEIVIIALVIVLLFGGKKIPELMRSLGQGVNMFKKGMNEDPTKTEDK